MAGYSINRYNGAVIASVADGTIDTTTDLKLIGKNYAGYGEIQNENFVFLLENFSNANPPPKPISGQLWFDSSNSKLKFYDGSKFRTTGGAEISDSANPPTGLTVGDFWWDTTAKQLFAWDGATFQLVGPQGVAGSGTTQMISRSVKEAVTGYPHAIIEARVGTGVGTYQTVFVISPDASFTLDPTTSSITGFEKIHQGITLAYTNDDSTLNIGQTQSNHRFWGTSTDADRLGGYPAGDYIRSGSADFATEVHFSDEGFTVGGTPKLRVFNTLSTTPVIQNQLNDTILFQTTSSGLKYPLTLKGSHLLPGGAAPGYTSNDTNDIGASGSAFRTVYATTFQGTASQASTLALGASYVSASTAATAGTIVARTTVDETINSTNITAGAIKATFFVGTATAANYADLAEKYLADAEYEVGTVVSIGGEKEVTACQKGTRAIGAVSGNPAYLMNFELENGTAIALKGRVPVKVTGPITKGDRLIAGDNGTAVSATWNTFDTFAVALESNSDEGVKLVECLIL